MNTPPPATTLPSRPPPIKVDCTWQDLEHLDRAHHEMDRAHLMLAYAVQLDGRNEEEHRRMLIDAAEDALLLARREFSRALRTLHMRAVVARQRPRLAMRRKLGRYAAPQK